MPRIQTPVRQVGQKFQADYFRHIGGLDTASNPMDVGWDTAARGSYNYEYTEQGSITKRAGFPYFSSTADSELVSLEIALREPVSTSSQVIRAAGSKIQLANLATVTFTNLTEDTATTNSTFWTSEDPVCSQMISTPDIDVLWLAGGGAEALYGVYSDTKVTKNGVNAPAGSINVGLTGTGSFSTTGEVYYSVALRKGSTQAWSNASLDTAVTLTTTNTSVLVTLSGITNIDLTKIDAIALYRQFTAVGGGAGFTAGALVTIVASSTVSITDNGVAASDAELVPRSGNTLLDNSTLPEGEYTTLALFKRRLVTVLNNTLYISDVNKPESWPLHNRFVLPSGSPVKGLGVVSFNTPTSTSLDELLAIFKENELRALSGTGQIDDNGVADWALNFISKDGACSHKGIVNAEGYLTWISRRGVFVWDGSGKPMYCSVPIENMWQTSGDITQADLDVAWGVYARDKSQVIWCVSHALYGTQKAFLKLDTKTSFREISSDLSSRVTVGRFIIDAPSIGSSVEYRSGAVLVAPGTTQQMFVIGDNAGHLIKGYVAASDAGSGLPFNYVTQFLDQDSVGVKKSYSKVIVWVDSLGDWDLTLDFWTDYRNTEETFSSNKLPIGAQIGLTAGLWDLGNWDEAFWDQADTSLKAIVFNLQSTSNNTLGDCIKLRFKNIASDNPITIKGWTIEYTEMGSSK